MLLNACKDNGLAVNTGKTKYKEIGRRLIMRVIMRRYQRLSIDLAFIANQVRDTKGRKERVTVIEVTGAEKLVN